MAIQLRINADDLIDLDDTVTAFPEDALQVRSGIAKGTLILTARGETPVEDLKVGDRVITRERGMSRLEMITKTTASAVTVRANSLGLGRPEQDTTLAGSQHVALRDWRAAALFDADVALVPVQRLADGAQIAAQGDAEFFQLEFGTPLTVYANGLETPTGRTETGVIETAAS
jgi:hypothetical protein